MVNIKKTLKVGEAVVCYLRIHSFFFVIGMFIFFTGIFPLHLLFPNLEMLNHPIFINGALGLGLLIMISTLIIKQNSFLLLTSERVIASSGIFYRKKFDIPIQKIEQVEVKQNLFQKCLNFATVIIRTEDDFIKLNCIKNPFLFKKRLDELNSIHYRMEYEYKHQFNKKVKS